MVSVLCNLQIYEINLLEIHENTRTVRETEKHAAMAHEAGKLIMKHLHSKNEQHGAQNSVEIKGLFQTLQKGLGLSFLYL